MTARDLRPPEVARPPGAAGTGTRAVAPHPRTLTRIESPGARDHAPAARLRRPARPGGAGVDEHLGAVLGSYRVLELLGKGGMGHVYRAEHVKLAREVALKLLRPDYATRRDAVARFFHEARAVSRVRHRNIVEVTDFVELDGGTTYLVMELLTGESLGAWAKRGVDLARALAVLVQICDGLGAAHQVGVVHRDLKPDNVMIVPTVDGAGLVKLLDFGVAKLVHREDEDVGFQTAAGSVIGTPAYMSPEQAGGMEIDPRSDIYALGAIMYELFAGQPVFRGRSFGEYVRMHLTELPVPPRQTPGGAAMPAALEAVILRCLDKDPAQRFADIGALRGALLGLLEAPGAAHAQREAPASAPSHPAVPVAAPPGWARLAGGALAICLGIAAAFAYTGGHARGIRPSRAASLPPSPASPRPAELARGHTTEVHLASLPSGGVFPADGATELCHTPCTLHLDLDDGGPADQRRFVVKRAGYADATVTVDLTGSTRDFRVVLHRATPTRPTSRPRPSSRRRARAPAADAAPLVTSLPDHSVAPAEPLASEPAPPDPRNDGPVQIDTPAPPIDPADTLDPFRGSP